LLDSRYAKQLLRLEKLSIEITINNRQLTDLGKLLAKALTSELGNIKENKELHPPAIDQEIKELNSGELFFHFLKNGELPWFSAQIEWSELDFTSQNFTTKLRELLKSSTLARERLVSQFSKYQVKEVLIVLYPSKPVVDLHEFLMLIERNTSKYSERYASGFRLQQQLLKSALEYLQKTGKDADFNIFLNHYGPSFALAAERECNGKHHEFLNFLGKASATYFTLKTSDKSGAAQPDFDEQSLSQKAINKTHDPQEILDEAWKESSTDTQQMVGNAGIILLHPFLNRFFNKVGLLENNRFISLDHQQRAICLLHNLATGEHIFPEEKLLLLKHLCGYPLQRSIPKELPISDFELQEVDSVLESAIQHWTALKRTSKDGLRVNFLQRKGMLEKDALGFTLHVENHAADVLLDQLPWGLSVVHFPWLPHLLTVKWR
ncbi:MAG: hypothetical protein HKN31_00130, partial [Pricia sp.]|nr:hypothetical protein [Pricia sp.]